MDIEILGLSLKGEISSEIDSYNRLSSIDELELAKPNVYSVIRHFKNAIQIPDSYLYKINYIEGLFDKSKKYNMNISFDNPVKVGSDMVTQSDIGIFKSSLLNRQLEATNEKDFINIVNYLFDLKKLEPVNNTYIPDRPKLTVLFDKQFSNSRYNKSKQLFSKRLDEQKKVSDAKRDVKYKELIETVFDNKYENAKLTEAEKLDIYNLYISEKSNTYVDKIQFEPVEVEYTLSTEEFFKRLDTKKSDHEFKLGLKLLHKTNYILSKYILTIDESMKKYLKNEILKLLMGVNSKFNYYDGDKKDVKVSFLEYLYLIGIIHYIYRNKKIPIKINKLTSTNEKEEIDFFLRSIQEVAVTEIKNLGLSEAKIRNLYADAIKNISDLITVENLSSFSTYREVVHETSLEMRTRIAAEIRVAIATKQKLVNVKGKLKKEEIGELLELEEHGKELMNLCHYPIKAFVHEAKWHSNSEYPKVEKYVFDPSKFSEYFKTYCPINKVHAGSPCKFCDYGSPKKFYDRFKYLIIDSIDIYNPPTVKPIHLAKAKAYESTIFKSTAKFKLKNPNYLFNLGKTEGILLGEVESKKLDMPLSKYHLFKINKYLKRKVDILNIDNTFDELYEILVVDLLESVTKSEIDLIIKEELDLCSKKVFYTIDGDFGEPDTDSSVNYQDMNPTIKLDDEEEYEEDDDYYSSAPKDSI